MNDEAIYAFNSLPAAPAAPPKAPAARRRLWPWVLGGLLLLAVLLVISGAVTLASLLHGGSDGLHVSIDGDDFSFGLLDGISGLVAVAGVFIGIVVALLCVLLVVPLTLLLVLLGVALAVAGVLLAVLLVVGVALSPLWLVVLLLWLVLRRPAPKVVAS